MPPKQSNLAIQDDHHVLRFAAYSRLHRDDDDNPIALLPNAFVLREGERSLSVTWVQFFEGDESEQLTQAIRAFVNSMDNPPRPSSAYGVGQVAAIKSACKARASVTVRILHEPSSRNAGHAGIHRYPRDNDDLMECLATEVFTKIIRTKDMVSVADRDEDENFALKLCGPGKR